MRGHRPSAVWAALLSSRSCLILSSRCFFFSFLSKSFASFCCFRIFSFAFSSLIFRFLSFSEIVFFEGVHTTFYTNCTFYNFNKKKNKQITTIALINIILLPKMLVPCSFSSRSCFSRSCCASACFMNATTYRKATPFSKDAVTHL